MPSRMSLTRDKHTHMWSGDVAGSKRADDVAVVEAEYGAIVRNEAKELAGQQRDLLFDGRQAGRNLGRALAAVHQQAAQKVEDAIAWREEGRG